MSRQSNILYACLQGCGCLLLNELYFHLISTIAPFDNDTVITSVKAGWHKMNKTLRSVPVSRGSAGWKQLVE